MKTKRQKTLTKSHRCLMKKVLQSKCSTKEGAQVTNTHGQVSFNSYLLSKKKKEKEQKKDLAHCDAYMILGNANTKQTGKNNENTFSNRSQTLLNLLLVSQRDFHFKHQWLS